MTKHAPEPLCPKCAEDRYDMVTTIRDGRRVHYACSTCGAIWDPPKERVTDVGGNQMYE
jgi:uncharacterized Zn finger protein